MEAIRKQLTLFPSSVPSVIEQIRAAFNPIQHQLISAHVTLCRAHELLNLTPILSNLEKLKLQPLVIEFNPPERFDEGKGLFLPAKPNASYQQLRKNLLQGLLAAPDLAFPHLTLIHPRNATCTTAIFEEISAMPIPLSMSFNSICLIEQRNGGKWEVIRRFEMK